MFQYAFFDRKPTCNNYVLSRMPNYTEKNPFRDIVGTDGWVKAVHTKNENRNWKILFYRDR